MRFMQLFSKFCIKKSYNLQDEKAFPLTILRPAATYNNTSAPICFLGQGTALLKRIRQGMPVIVLGDGLSIWVSSHRDDVGNAFIVREYPYISP